MISYGKMSSAGGAANYLTAERTDARAEYYAKENSYSAWGGQGAVVHGLTPGQKVEKDDFVKVLEGKLNNPVIQQAQELGRVTAEGLDHRPGLDLTFSAPKSVSLAGILGKDERVIAAHEAAVASAMSFLEKQASTRVRTSNKSIEYRQTGNLIYAKFQHETSRAMDPQLHTHVAVANATYDLQDEQWRSLEYHSLVRDLKTADALYKNELAGHLNQLGYETDWTKNGPEIAGITREQIETFSKRTAAIDGALEAKGVSREEASASLRNKVSVETRDKKRHIDRSELLGRWRDEAKTVGLKIENIVSKAIGREKHGKGVQSLSDANRVVGKAIRHISQNEQAFSRSELVRQANEFAKGGATPAEIEKAIKVAETAGRLVNKGKDSSTGHDTYTTPAAIAAEKALVAHVEAGRNVVSPVMSRAKAELHLEARDVAAVARGGHALDEGQRKAAMMVLTSTDRFNAIQGYAGAGKTTMMDTVRSGLESSGKTVIGLSNGAEQAAKLQKESGIPSQTVASFLLEFKQENPSLGEKVKRELPRVAKFEAKKAMWAAKNYLKGIRPSKSPGKVLVRWAKKKTIKAVKQFAKTNVQKALGIAPKEKTPRAWHGKDTKNLVLMVDEASMLSLKDMNSLMGLAEKNGIRVEFVGDKNQHQSVGAGRAFEAAQDAGIQKSTLETVYRQKDDAGKEAVSQLIKGDYGQAFDTITAVEGQCVEVRGAVAALEANGRQSSPEAVREAQATDSKSLIDKTAEIYLSQKNPTENALCFTATNQSRIELNEAIRDKMKERGLLKKDELKVETLTATKLTAAQKTEAWRYEKGMLVIADREYKSQGIKRGDQFRVQGNDQKKNSVQLERVNFHLFRDMTIDNRHKSESFTWRPDKRTSFTPYESSKVGMAVGDSIRFTKNGVYEGANNGTKGVVTSVGSGSLTVDIGDKKINVKTDDALHLQHRYASTTYKDQGNDAAKGIYHVDTTRAGGVGTRDAYVGLTRAKEGTIIVTNDKQKARELVQREQDKTLAVNASVKKEQGRDQEQQIQDKQAQGLESKVDGQQRGNGEGHAQARTENRSSGMRI